MNDNVHNPKTHRTRGLLVVLTFLLALPLTLPSAVATEPVAADSCSAYTSWPSGTPRASSLDAGDSHWYQFDPTSHVSLHLYVLSGSAYLYVYDRDDCDEEKDCHAQIHKPLTEGRCTVGSGDYIIEIRYDSSPIGQVQYVAWTT